MDDSKSLILISALTSSQLHLKMEETNDEINVDDSVPFQEDTHPPEGKKYFDPIEYSSDCLIKFNF